MLFILQKTAKSIQRHLNEFLDALAGEATGRIGERAVRGPTHAPSSNTLLLWNSIQRDCVPAVYPADGSKQVQRWRGHRLLGIDSSLLRLPNHPELFEQFTPVEIFANTGAPARGIPRHGCQFSMTCLIA